MTEKQRNEIAQKSAEIQLDLLKALEKHMPMSNDLLLMILTEMASRFASKATYER